MALEACMRFSRQQEDKQEDEGSLSTLNDCSSVVDVAMYVGLL